MMKKMLRIAILVLILSFMFTVCGSVGFAEEPAVSATDLTGAEVTLNPQYTVYTGVAVVPQVTVKLENKILTSGVDYSLSIPMIKNTGIYTVEVTGMGDYTGTAKSYCSIMPVDLNDASIKLTRGLTTADLSKDHKTIVPSVLNSIVRVNQAGVNVSSWCTLSSSIDGNKVTITAAINNGDGINVMNSSISSIITMKTHMEDCVIELGEEMFVYNGEQQIPSVVIYNTISLKTLKEKEDYIVQYKDNINTGFASVTAIGIGDYTGNIIRYYYIEPKDLYNCTTFITGGRSSSAYTGKEIQPLATVRDGAKKVLIKDKDYTVSYTDKSSRPLKGLLDAGEYNVIVEGYGNYTGKIELPYEIIGTDVDGYEINLRYDKVKADGTAKVPEILSVQLGDKSVLTASEYDVSYLDPAGNPVTEMIKPGVYTVVATAKNGFSGTITTTFEIVGAEQEIILPKTAYKAYKKTANFKLAPEATGDATGFTFVSSNPKVASVSADGVVDVKKLGRAVITIKTTGETIYQPAVQTVEVKVYPYKAVMTQKPWTDGAKKSFKVRWETQEDVTYYQVRYSRNKNFKSGTYNTKKVTQNTKGYKTQSTTIKGLKSGQKYYVKVRAVKVVEDEHGDKIYYYGNWSGWKSVKTK